MVFADFFYSNNEETSALGDRSVVILDGRYKIDNMIYHAKNHGNKYGFKYFRLNHGDSFTRSKPFTDFISV